MELCAGTHARATGEIGLFRIVSEAAIAAGTRRIEAVAGLRSFETVFRESERLRALAVKLNSPVADVEKKLDALLTRSKELEKALKTASQKESADRARELAATAEFINGIPTIIANLGADGRRHLAGNSRCAQKPISGRRRFGCERGWRRLPGRRGFT